FLLVLLQLSHHNPPGKLYNNAVLQLPLYARTSLHAHPGQIQIYHLQALMKTDHNHSSTEKADGSVSIPEFCWKHRYIAIHPPFFLSEESTCSFPKAPQ